MEIIGGNRFLVTRVKTIQRGNIDALQSRVVRAETEHDDCYEKRVKQVRHLATLKPSFSFRSSDYVVTLCP